MALCEKVSALSLDQLSPNHLSDVKLSIMVQLSKMVQLSAFTALRKPFGLCNGL
jgi:hypothetical protein